MKFRDLLKREFERRKGANGRYSLRRMALDLAVDHSTLSQILRGERKVPGTMLRSAGRRLGLSAEEISAYLAAEQIPDAAVSQREEQLRHWAAEAQAVLSEAHHYGLLCELHRAEFRADVRVLAARLAVEVDAVNVAVARLARLGFLDLRGPAEWVDREKLGLGSLPQFRRRALQRVRELAPMFPKSLSKRVP